MSIISELIVLPKEGSTVYNINKKGSKTIRSFKLSNKLFMVPFYRLRFLPLIGFGRIILLLHTTGKKSGKRRITPLEFLDIEEDVYIFASRGFKSDWLRNIESNPDKIKIQKGFRTKKAEALIIENLDEYRRILTEYISRRPKPARLLFGWDEKTDRIERTDFSTLMKILVAIKITILS